jgi:hypothetical protein
MSPAKASYLLGLCGWPMTERRLVDWRVRQVLPDVKRVPPPRGKGPRAAYGWSDREVVVQALTLCASLTCRGRLETAQLLTWLAGFEYPVATMRQRWADLEESRWRWALRSVGESPSGDIEAGIDALVMGAKAARATQRLDVSDATVRTYVRAIADPIFDPGRDITRIQAERICRDLPRIFRGPAYESLLDYVRPEHIQRLAADLRDYVSTPRLVGLIRSLSDEELEAVHRDCRFLMGAYRAWISDAMMRAERGEEFSKLALLWTPRMVWRLGRGIMIIDIAVRREGFATELRQTLEALETLTASSENRETIVWLWQLNKQLLAVTGTDPNRYLAAFRERLDAAHAEAAETLVGLIRALLATFRDIWEPGFRNLLATLRTPATQCTSVTDT